MRNLKGIAKTVKNNFKTAPNPWEEISKLQKRATDQEIKIFELNRKIENLHSMLFDLQCEVENGNMD